MAKEPNKPAKKPDGDVDARFQLLLTMIALLKSARHKPKKSELEFLIVNQTFNIFPYRQCVYWERAGDDITVKAVSGLVHLDPHGPYVMWLRRVIGDFVRTVKNPAADDDAAEQQGFATVHEIGAADCAKEQAADWPEWMAAHALMVVMRDRSHRPQSGILLDRDAPFSPLELAVLEDLGDGYAHALQYFDRDGSARRLRGWKSLFALTGTNFRRAMIALFLVMLIPVQSSVSGPAEIVARAPIVVSIPMDGVVRDVAVVPGQKVKRGDVLIRLEDTILRNKMEIAEGEMRSAITALDKTEREVLSDKSKLADIAVLRAQLNQKEAEMNYARDMLGRTTIAAERDGIVIFSDPSAIRGKPVQTGEQMMLLADPDDSELLIRVPVSSMIRINADIPARFFLNVAPFGSHRARYETIGYQATPDPDGLMTYKIRARFDGGDRPRIGWTGTGKVYGDRTVLGLNILRRPLVTLRRKVGI